MREILASIDIGSTLVKLVVAEINNEKFNLLCALSEECQGVNHGMISEPDKVSFSIQKLLKKAENILGFKLSKAIVSVNEDAADFKIGEASIQITDQDKEITGSDIGKVLKASTVPCIENNMELVTVMPIHFKVDDKKTHNPQSLRGSTLSVKSVVITVPKKEVYLAAKCLEKCGIEVVDIMISSLADYFAYKNETIDTLVGCVIDIGGESTNIGIINKGITVNNLVLPHGGNELDKDIAFVYKITESEARKLKETFGYANRKNAYEKETETIVNRDGENIIINEVDLSNVIMSRLREMLNMSKNEINYLTKKEISYIIVTGGLTELKDFDIEVESVFGKIAKVKKLNIVGARDNRYANAVGMIKYFDYKLKLRDSEYTVLTKDDEDILSGTEKRISESSLLGKVFGLFFDN